MFVAVTSRLTASTESSSASMMPFSLIWAHCSLLPSEVAVLAGVSAGSISSDQLSAPQRPLLGPIGVVSTQLWLALVEPPNDAITTRAIKLSITARAAAGGIERRRFI